MRIASPSDALGLSELEATLFDNAMGEKVLAHEITLGEAWIEGDYEGYILWRKDGDLIDILRLGVRADREGQGLGRRLLEKALANTNKAILTVKKNNVRAIVLYRHMGFQVIAHLLTANAWVLQWERVTSSEA